MKNVDHVISAMVGFFIAMIFGIAFTQTTRTDVLEKACGTCTQRAQVCGNFTCTQDGWK